MIRRQINYQLAWPFIKISVSFVLCVIYNLTIHAEPTTIQSETITCVNDDRARKIKQHNMSQGEGIWSPRWIAVVVIE